LIELGHRQAMLPRRIGGRDLASDQIQHDGSFALGRPTLDIPYRGEGWVGT
jgi:hypothetical protein